MAYSKQAWRDYDDTKTENQNRDRGAVVTPERLNHMETGIANSAERAELEQTKQDITSQLAHTASKNEVNSLLGRIADGTPNFADSVSEMTDTTKLYVNLSDGYLYANDGESWVSTGVKYQEKGISDNNVKFNHLNNDIIGFDGYKVEFTSNGNGVLVFTFDVNNLDIINKELKISSTFFTDNVNVSQMRYRFVAGDSGTATSGNFIQPTPSYTDSIAGKMIDLETVVSPTGDYNFIHVWFEVQALDATKPISFFYKDLLFSVSDTPLDIYDTTFRTGIGTTTKIEQLPNQLITGDKLKNEIDGIDYAEKFYAEATQPINLVDLQKVTIGKFVTGRGSFPNNSDYVISDYIPVEEGERYSSGNTQNKAYYTKDKTFVGYFTDRRFTVPIGENIAYVVSTFRIDSYQTEMIVKGDIYPPYYIPYRKKDLDRNIIIRPEQILDSRFEPVFKRRWEGKKWSALGDSLTYGISANNNNYVVQASKKMLIAEVFNYGVSATRISTSSSGNSFLERYLAMEKESDLITVFGGVNDFTGNAELGTFESRDTTTFYGALHALCIGLGDNFPDARVAFFTPIIRDKLPNAKGVHQIEFVNAIKEVCAYYSIPVLDLFSKSGLDYTVDGLKKYYAPGDPLHPNELGHTRMTNLVVSFLESI